MKINMYCMEHGVYVFNPRHISEDYRQMKDMGCDAVTLSILEQHPTCQKSIHNHCVLAHEAGLEVHFIPARFGGLFAGAPKVPSAFAMSNLDTLIVDADGRRHGVCCTEHPRVREFFAEQLDELLGKYDFDGVVLDEPKGGEVVCHCEHCRKAFGDRPSKRDRESSLKDFLSWLCRQMKGEALKYRPDQWIFFYYPHNTEDPERLMGITRNAISSLRGDRDAATADQRFRSRSRPDTSP